MRFQLRGSRFASKDRGKAQRRALPLGLFGWLAIVVAIERHVDRNVEVFGTIHSIEWRWVGPKIEREAATSRVLCFGSSFTRMGVAATVLEERLGVSAYNFAISGAQPFAHYTALRRALGAGAKPAAIVVDFAWTTLATPDDWSAPVLPEFATPLECAELAIAARAPGLFARLAVAKALPTFRRLQGVRTYLRGLFTDQDPGGNAFWPYMARNGNVNRGSVLAKPMPQVGIELNDPGTFPLDWACTPLAEKYTNAFLELAGSCGVPVFWLISPISPQAQAHRDELGLEARYTDFVRRVASRHRGVVVVDGRGAKYGPEAFVDMVHLNRNGAVDFTTDLAEIIRPRLGDSTEPPTCWVSLPDPRHDPLASRVEDIDDSSRELQRLWSGGLRR